MASGNQDLIDEAESFAAGCSRTRIELRLVDALKEAEKKIQELSNLSSIDNNLLKENHV